MYSDNSSIVQQCERDVAAAKKRLLRFAERHGVCENFGQKDVRKLHDKYSQYDWQQSADGRDIRYILAYFNKWCMEYTGGEG